MPETLAENVARSFISITLLFSKQSSSSTTNTSSTIMEAMEDNNMIKDHHQQKIIKEKTLQSCPDKVMTSMANVFDSVQRFENSRMCINKKFLLDPKPVGGHGASLLAAMTSAAAEDSSGNDGGKGRNLTAGYFRCGQSCIFMTSKFGTTCPKHNRRMETKCKIVQEVTQGQTTGGGGGGSNSTGYVGGGTQYMITNTLEIFASAAIQTLLKLNLIRSERIGDLDTMEIQCSPKEVLQLLKASLSSTNVLNEVFGKHCAN
ncbi:hypothetical protein BDL97_18G056900 [Sphagnum fallax]|nr:hypothetical protein BDL97_18G056900 [Sphagnum fallax]